MEVALDRFGGMQQHANETQVTTGTRSVRYDTIQQQTRIWVRACYFVITLIGEIPGPVRCRVFSRKYIVDVLDIYILLVLCMYVVCSMKIPPSCTKRRAGTGPFWPSEAWENVPRPAAFCRDGSYIAALFVPLHRTCVHLVHLGTLAVSLASDWNLKTQDHSRCQVFAIVRFMPFFWAVANTPCVKSLKGAEARIIRQFSSYLHTTFPSLLDREGGAPCPITM